MGIGRKREIRMQQIDSSVPIPAREWVLPNIFAPFETEHELGLECGSLWDEWMEGMRRQVTVLAERYCGKGDIELEQRTAG